MTSLSRNGASSATPNGLGGSSAASSGLTDEPGSRHVPLAETQAGQKLAGTYVLRKLELRQARNGSHYLDLELGDASGGMPGKLWDASPEEADRLREVDYVQVEGKVELYKDRKQASLRRVEPAVGTIDPLAFLPRTRLSLRDLFARLAAIHQTIACPHLRELINSFLGEEGFRRRFLLAPAAVSHHHAYLGGLIEHVVSLSEACLRICDAYPALDRDLLLAGAFFHDIGKVEELSIGKQLEYSDKGRLIGHIVTGAIWVQERARRIPGFPPETLCHLEHLILSHHGTKEWGSPVEPCTAEAIALHYLDNLDAKLWAFAKLVENGAQSPSTWTDYAPTFGRRMYKGARPASAAANDRGMVDEAGEADEGEA